MVQAETSRLCHRWVIALNRVIKEIKSGRTASNSPIVEEPTSRASKTPPVSHVEIVRTPVSPDKAPEQVIHADYRVTLCVHCSFNQVVMVCAG